MPLMCHIVNGHQRLDPVRVAVLVFIIAVTLASGLFVYQVNTKGNPPVEFMEIHGITLDKREYVNGERVTEAISMCQLIDTPGELHRTFVNGINYSTELRGTLDLPVGCYENLIIVVDDVFRIPENLPPSEYHIKYDVVYDVPLFFNLITFPRKVTTYSRSFEVVSPE